MIIFEFIKKNIDIGVVGLKWNQFFNLLVLLFYDWLRRNYRISIILGATEEGKYVLFNELYPY